MTFIEIFGHPPLEAGLIVLNLILIESLLSIDNAAVLAAMVRKLPKDQRTKALRYGIIGAYVFRGLALGLAYWMVKLWWIKLVGGMYLLYLAGSYFAKHLFPVASETASKHTKAEASLEGGDAIPEHVVTEIEEVEKTGLFRRFQALFSALGIHLTPFWRTVALVELMDLAFSIDNVIAATAYTSNMILICVGVFIGILAMRFVAGWFVKLLERFPALEHGAYLVIALLAIKLLLSSACNMGWMSGPFCAALEAEMTDTIFSGSLAALLLGYIGWAWLRARAATRTIA